MARTEQDGGLVESAVRVVPWAALGALLLLIVRVGSAPLSNPDTWFHLRIGHELLGPWSLRDPGSLSRFATADWVPTQWSVQMLAAGFEDWFGLPGVAWLFGLFYLILVVTVYFVCRRESAPMPAVLVTAAVVFAASSSISARPQVVSLILVGVTVSAWLHAARSLRAPWWLVPLTWVWATAHGFWSVGVLIGVVSCVGLLLDRRLDRRTSLAFFAVPVLSLVAACVTPVGPALLDTQFAVSERSSLIGEWGATSFHAMPAVVGASMLGLLVVIWARRGGVTWTSLLLLLVAAALTAYAVRTVSLGAVIAAPLLAGALQGVIGDRPGRPAKGEICGVVGAVVACAVLLGVVLPHTAASPKLVPDGFALDLASLPDGSAVMVDGTSGSWLEWQFPELQPTMDGMFDAYTLDYMREYRSARDLEPGWQDFIRETDARAALLREGGPLTFALMETMNWREIGRDDAWVLLEAP